LAADSCGRASKGGRLWKAGPCEEEAVANEVEVTKASEQFYSALNKMINGDASVLAGI
jgi:hypothetical protein